jgi:hypothetical protein
MALTDEASRLSSEKAGFLARTGSSAIRLREFPSAAPTWPGGVIEATADTMMASVDRRGAMTGATGIMTKALDGLPGATTFTDTQDISG